MDNDDLRRAVADGMPQTIADLERLVRIPSIGAPGYDPSLVRASAETTVEILRSAGVGDARLLELDGGHPAVYGAIDGPADAPIVLLYAHHDVQPEGPADRWQSPPFDPVVREGRLYGRGAADDKSGIVAHAAALRSLGVPDGATPPATVRIVIEGEEECSTEHLPQLVQGHADLLRADVVVIADGGNERTGVPTIGTSVRGVTDCRVTVRVLPIAQHSGAYGGPIPDAITALCRMIATLHDDRGEIAIGGLHQFAWPGAPVTEASLREESRVFDSVKMIGSGTIADRLFAKPAVAVVGFDAPAVAGSSNQIVPQASARVSLRLAPGDDPERARDALVDHLRAAAPWGVQVEIEADEAGMGYMVDTTTPAYAVAKSALADAFEHEVVEMGSGGSVPIVPMLAEAFPGMAVLIWGAGDERSNYHSLDESVDLADLERLVLAQALFIRNLGDGTGS
ncbi:MAG TPA: M20/M25/M40 family metallo-hydrolase [Actinomycetota bacterium]|nr:M20/M25/M40 family metallo-hydrolase [Actinomycetota bacterium]